MTFSTLSRPPHCGGRVSLFHKSVQVSDIDNMNKKPKVIVIIGPTASGKSSLGIFLAQKLKGEIISADSRQVYKDLNIGTGKVTKKEMVSIPHYLLDVVSPKRVFTASDFLKLGEKTIQKILKDGNTPFVVGGTGLYVDVLLGRIVVPEVAPNPVLRTRLEKKSVEQLFALLKKQDPERAITVEPRHKRRLVRALEIAAVLGKSPKKKIEEKYEVLWLGLNPGENILYKNIHIRLQARMKQGMVAEAKRLHMNGLSYKRMEALGLEYRSLARYLKKEISRVEMENELERAIQKYAKRQLRWFKRNSDINWIKNRTEALRLTKNFLSGPTRTRTWINGFGDHRSTIEL
jgi:tRNA dimethylallyltransferase